MAASNDFGKAVLALAAAGFLALGLVTAALATAYHFDDSDLKIHRGTLFSIIALIGGGLYCGWLLRHLRHESAKGRVNASSSGATLLWLADMVLAGVLALYFWDDAGFEAAQYGSLLVGRNTLVALGLAAWAVVLGSASALARGVGAIPAGVLFALLASAMYVSEASSAWLGF
jgi:hypothetical protein